MYSPIYEVPEQIILHREIYAARRRIDRYAAEKTFKFNVLEREKDRMVYEVSKAILSHKRIDKEVQVPFKDTVQPKVADITIPSEKYLIWLPVLSALVFVIGMLTGELVSVGLSAVLAGLGVFLYAYNGERTIPVRVEPVEVEGFVKARAEEKVLFPESDLNEYYPESLGTPIVMHALRPLEPARSGS